MVAAVNWLHDFGTGEDLKRCSRCRLWRSLRHYTKNSRRRDGLMPECKACRKKLAARRYQTNRTIILESNAKWREENAEHMNALNSAWARNNPEKTRAKRARRRSLELAFMSSVDKDISIEYRKAIKADPCKYCRRQDDSMTVDHVVPLSKNGTDHWFNLVPACQSCNSSKGNKTLEEWASRSLRTKELV